MLKHEIFSYIGIQNDKNQRFNEPENSTYLITYVPIVSKGTTCITRKPRFNEANKMKIFRKFL